MKITIKIILLLITMTSYSQHYEIKGDTVIFLKDGCYNISSDTIVWVSIDTVDCVVDDDIDTIKPDTNKSDTTYIDYIEVGLNSIYDYNEYIDSILKEIKLLEANNDRRVEWIKSNINSTIKRCEELDNQHQEFLERYNYPKLDSVPTLDDMLNRLGIEQTIIERYFPEIFIVSFVVIVGTIFLIGILKERKDAN